MTGERSNWARATEGWLVSRRPIAAALLVAVGQRLGVQAAHDLYFGLAVEPVDPHGARVDWLVIRARIGTAAPATEER